MRTLIHECEYGTIEYRLPTIPDTTKLMNSLKQFRESQDEVGALTWFIDNLGPYLVKIQLILGDEIIDTYEKLMDYPEMLNELVLISNVIMEKSLGTIKKKQ